MKNKYPISSYNKNISLKVNLMMMIIFIIMLKPFLVMLLSLVNKRDRFQLIDMFYPDRGMLSLSGFAAIPVAMLVYAWMRREPGAASLVRRLWANGSNLIVITSLLNLVIIASHILVQDKFTIPFTELVQALIYLAIIITAYKSQYIKDCFSDFPQG